MVFVFVLCDKGGLNLKLDVFTSARLESGLVFLVFLCFLCILVVLGLL